jgi:hypothetical protein
MSVLDQTPSQSSKVQERLEVRSLREVLSSCDRLNLKSEQTSLSASIDSSIGSESARKANTSWVASFHDKTQSKTPAKYAYGTPTHRQLDFSTPAPRQPERPSPTVSSVYSDRWCLESVTPAMRYTPPNMGMRGMRVTNGPREAIAAYRMDGSVRRENERGNSLCILPTPLLRWQSNEREPLAELSPQFVPSRPSPTISAWSSPIPTPTPVGPVHKKPRAGINSKHFPIPRLSGGPNNPRRGSLEGLISKQPNSTSRTKHVSNR